jgi:glycyl-tRNA synthetase alpha subunit
MEVSIILALITLGWQIISIFVQRKSMNTDIKKKEADEEKTKAETSSLLIEKALSINKQELENLTILYKEVRQENKELREENKYLRTQLQEKEEKL